MLISITFCAMITIYINFARSYIDTSVKFILFFVILEQYLLALQWIRVGIYCEILKHDLQPIGSFSGVGTAAGWLYPIGEFVKKNGQTNIMQVTECNAIVKTATNFFKSMCLPGALTSFYNPFGKLVAIWLRSDGSIHVVEIQFIV